MYFFAFSRTPRDFPAVKFRMTMALQQCLAKRFRVATVLQQDDRFHFAACLLCSVEGALDVPLRVVDPRISAVPVHCFVAPGDVVTSSAQANIFLCFVLFCFCFVLVCFVLFCFVLFCLRVKNLHHSFLRGSVLLFPALALSTGSQRPTRVMRVVRSFTRSAACVSSACASKI